MSVTVVTLLAIAGLCCILVLTTLLALLRVAAHSDAQLEREAEHERELPDLRLPALAAGDRDAVDGPSPGRFSRRRDARTDSGDRPLVR